MTLAVEAPERHAGRLRPIHVVAVAAGNGLEFFDFLIYATFAIFIGKAYFPNHDPAVGLREVEVSARATIAFAIRTARCRQEC